LLNFDEKEVKIVEYWRKNDINRKVREKGKGKKKFYFLDGPPFVTGDLHPGQVWVKSIKDAFLRYKRYRGYNVRDRAGYDVHGLPIENKVENLLKVKSKKDIEETIGVEEFIKQCKNFVDSYHGRMDKDYERFGISLDFSDPYIPSKMEYMEKEWKVFKEISDKGYLYKSKKTTPFCPHCQTAVSPNGNEIVYSDSEDPSLYVRFKVVNNKSGLVLEPDTYLLIWTTTPWTLVSNVAIAANPDERYVLVSNGQYNLIIAKARMERVAAALNANLIVKQEFYGSELKGLYYESPLKSKVPKQGDMEDYHKIIFSKEFVTMDEGTGLVHIAPGHGPEDYKLGIENKLPIFSPVDESGFYTKDAGAYSGLKVPDEANSVLLKDLEEIGAVVAKSTIKHQYPHCWRCDNKIVFIATEQWFFNVQKIKSKLIKENDKVHFHPESAKDIMKGILLNSPDWTISRQRYWGTPIPIWKCSNPSCGHNTIIGSIEELKMHAKDKEEIERLNDLHRPSVDRIVLKCEKCGSDSFRIPDVLDVWVDSGIAFRASMNEDEFKLFFPIDMIAEGPDQFRGWFSCLLKLSVFTSGKKPYQNVLVNGWLVDEHGKQMHKKLGNYLPLETIYSKYGVDPFRFWSLEHTPWLDLPFNQNEISDAVKTVSIVYNISNLIKEYSELLNYKPSFKKRISLSNLEIADKYIISRLESTILFATELIDSYKLFEAVSAMKEFLVEDYSRFYLKIAKKQILYSKKARAKKVLDILSYVTSRMLVLLSIIIPFSTESVYLELFNEKESIFLEDWPKPNKRFIDNILEKEMRIARDSISALLSAREKSNIPLRWPIAHETLEVRSQEAYNAVEKFSLIIKELTNAKELEIKQNANIKEEIKPVFSNIGPDFKEKAQAVAEALSSVNPEELKRSIDEHEYYPLHTSKGEVNITSKHFIIVSRVENPNAVLFNEGVAYVSNEISKELKEEALIREFERRIQLMRKEMQLKKKDIIELSYDALPELADIIERNKREIAKTINADKIKNKIEGDYKEFKIDTLEVKVQIKISTGSRY